ncbi:MAG TPA: hypothetical protein ENK05_10360 [Gammaproteobacteria bacterium]|nr:hypothetical protein [Gammaproteobacteria bacterium]
MKITLIVPYFGSWPPWFYAFLLSCKWNPSVQWLFYTDCGTPRGAPENVRFVAGSLEGLSALASRKLGFAVNIAHGYKVCDLRPAFGRVFSDYLSGSDFWGHCDVDVIWGDIRGFIDDDILAQHDVISARKHNIAGHFTLYRNTEKMSGLYTLIEDFEARLRTDINYWLDERGMTPLVRVLENRGFARVYWPRFLLNFASPATERPSDLSGYSDGWCWKRGKLYDQTAGGGEIMYLHFMTWKDSLRQVDFSWPDEPESFRVSSTAILAGGECP